MLKRLHASLLLLLLLALSALHRQISWPSVHALFCSYTMAFAPCVFILQSMLMLGVL